jgi:hypothetical protein
LFIVEDPSAGKVKEHELPADPTDLSAGTWRARLRIIPMGKYRALCREIVAADADLNRLTVLLAKMREETPQTLEEYEAAQEKRARFAIARDKAEQARVKADRDLVAWCFVGHADIETATGDQIPFRAAEERWASLTYELAAPETLDLYERQGLLAFLSGCVLAYHKRTLPRTAAELFAKEPDPDPKPPTEL